MKEKHITELQQIVLGSQEYECGAGEKETTYYAV